MNENLIQYVMDDPEVLACMANSFQIAVIIAATLEFLRNQPERLSEKTSKEDAIV